MGDYYYKKKGCWKRVPRTEKPRETRAHEVWIMRDGESCEESKGRNGKGAEDGAEESQYKLVGEGKN